MEAVQHLPQDALRFVDRANAVSGDSEQTFRAAAAFGRGLAGARLDQALRLEPAQRGVDRADRHVAPGPGLDFLADGDTIGSVAEPEDRQQDDLLELAKVGRPHYLYNIGQMNGAVTLAIALVWAALVVAALWSIWKRRRRLTLHGAAAAGTIYDLLNDDRRKALEIIVEQRAEAQDPEDKDGNLPDLEEPRRSEHPTGSS